MQLKGLVRFFTILLILYSIYELSFTWVVRSHEKKMEARATNFVNLTQKNATPALKDQAYKDRLRRLLDSTKDVTVHYGPTGKISYQKAKENELNLGLDLQGGLQVLLEANPPISNPPADRIRPSLATRICMLSVGITGAGCPLNSAESV